MNRRRAANTTDQKTCVLLHAKLKGIKVDESSIKRNTLDILRNVERSYVKRFSQLWEYYERKANSHFCI
ncbi:unnamed protein product, partial [Larinioides sclopetarius]